MAPGPQSVRPEGLAQMDSFQLPTIEEHIQSHSALSRLARSVIGAKLRRDQVVDLGELPDRDCGLDPLSEP